MRYVIMTVALLGLAAPALADEGATADDELVALTDAQLDDVAAGHGRTLKLNISPIVLVQRNTSINVQIAIANVGSVIVQSNATTQANLARVVLKIFQ